MPNPLAVAGGGSVLQAGASIYGANKAAGASKEAARLQARSQQQGIDEQRRQFDAIQQLLSPYVQAGQPGLTQPYIAAGPEALQGMQALLGIGGESERQRALFELKQSPEFANIADVTQNNINNYLRERDVQLEAFKKSREYKKVPVAKGESRLVAQANLITEFNKETEAAKRNFEAQANAQREALLRPILEDKSYAQIGADRQRQAIQKIEQGPLFQELLKKGEEGILQNASATGGLRGGNTQGALAQFRPGLLNQLIEAQYGKLAGLTTLGSTSAQNLLGIGQASAAGTAAAGQQSAQNIGNLLAGQGQALAAGQIGVGQAYAQGAAGVGAAAQGGLQNYMLMQQLNKPSMASGIGTGGFYGSYAEAQQAYGPGTNLQFQNPVGPGAPGGFYGTPA